MAVNRAKIERAINKTQNNAREFAQSLYNLSAIIDGDVSQVIRLGVLHVFKRVIEISPVDTGAYRANHGISTEEPEPSGLREVNESSWNQQTETALGGGMDWTWEIGDGDIWLYNNMPYAEVLEAGHSGQAPDGVYAVALSELEQQIRREVNKVKGVS